MSTPAFMAVDWGTTNRRVYVIDARGAVLATERDEGGVLSTPREAFAPAVAVMRERFGDVAVLCAGMVGSTRGWVEVPYLPCPAGIDELAAGLHWVEPGRTAIVPGLSVTGARADVMRGEEVQLVGAVRAGLAPGDALLVQPGTHCKWARMTAGRVASFRTAMTGELFALLRRHSLLAEFLAGEVAEGPDFAEGLDLARQGTLLSSLFGERAGVVLGLRDADSVASRVSGLLLGTDVREQGLAPGEQAFILADPVLGGLYAQAVRAFGGEPVAVDSHQAFVAGINAVWEKTGGR